MLARCRPMATLVMGFAVLGYLAGCQSDDAAMADKTKEPSAKPATPVEVVTLQSQSVTLTTDLPGRVMPFRIAQVRPQVDGIVIDRLLKEGLEVTAGQPLYQIDPRRFQAAVNSAKAELLKAQASLAAVKITEERYQGLLGTQAVSEQQYDDIKALRQQREAEVAVAEAALKAAQVDLEYTLIKAPIEGRIEQFMVTEGAMVEELQELPMATIRQLDPVYVDINQPARDLVAIRKAALDGELLRDENPRIQITLEDGSAYPYPGEVLYEEMNVNTDTGSVLVRAMVANPDRLLMPGQFVKVTVENGTLEDALLVPQAAVIFNRQGQPEVLLVDGDNTISRRPLQLGQSMGDGFLVKDGLQAGDRVVVAGLQKVSVGTLVSPVEQTPRQAGIR